MKNIKISRSENMSRIRGINSYCEISLRSELWKRGFHYFKNDKKVFGKPDISFRSKKVAIFCDSEFWHGKKFINGEIPKTNKEFWEDKFKKNILRDKKVNETLYNEGWKVIRIWEKDIKKNVSKCADKIEKVLKGK